LGGTRDGAGAVCRPPGVQIWQEARLAPQRLCDGSSSQTIRRLPKRSRKWLVSSSAQACYPALDGLPMKPGRLGTIKRNGIASCSPPWTRSTARSSVSACSVAPSGAHPLPQRHRARCPGRRGDLPRPRGPKRGQVAGAPTPAGPSNSLPTSCPWLNAIEGFLVSAGALPQCTVGWKNVRVLIAGSEVMTKCGLG
jgi:hypothetical protein